MKSESIGRSSSVKWMTQRYSKWHTLRGIGMTKNTIGKDGMIEEVHYFIFSFHLDVSAFSQSIWSHWLLDVVSREEQHQVLGNRATFNLKAIRKYLLYFLKAFPFSKKAMSYRWKHVHLKVYLPQLFGK